MSANFKITFDTDKLRRRLVISKDKIEELGNEILIVLADRFVELVKERAPRKTGKYADDWKREEPQNGVIAITNPDGLKFNMFEFTGSMPHKIEAKNANVLHFQIDGKDIFVKFVNHPGFQPIPHVRPSLEQVGSEAKSIILGMIKAKFPLFK